jgi:nondiscriminating aspartyl-tRNA synthetase
MSRTLSSDTINKVGETVLIKGWVNTRRDHGKIVFIDLRDRTGVIQVVLSPELAAGLRPEDVFYVTGLVKTRPDKLVNPNLVTGTVEIEAQKVEIVAKAAELPFDMGQTDLNLELPTLLDNRSLSLRHAKIRAIFKVQEVIIDSFRKALQAKDFVEFQAPSIISSVPEGGAEVFKVKYFNYEAYLSQSPQLYKSLLVGAFERVFSVNKVFRAEPSVTTRHLTEVVSLDAEMGFIDSWTDVLDMQEYVVKYIFSEVQKLCAPELELFHATLPQVTDKIPLIKLRDAQEIIYKRTGRDCRQEKDLAPEDEKEICRYALEKFGSELIFVSHFLTKKKPFYVYPDPADPEYAFSVDLIGRGVEWSSGGQRLNDYQSILKNVKEWGLKEEDIELYLQSFRFAVPPLGGFALGAERMTMHILGLQNIREASMFPRDMERVDVRLSTIQKTAKKPVGI